MQMDSVIGRPGGKCLLTVPFIETSFMLGFLRDSNRKEYDAFFQALKGAGYDHAISFEAYSRNFINDLKKSLIIGNELWQS